MIGFWYGVVALMLGVYVTLDGFDLGAGILHLFIAKSDRERRAVLASIGPVWDGNEVWLIAAGGALFCAFPAAYAASFSGFYLPLMLVLWLIILRGLAIELRSHLDQALWTDLWDAVFALASTLLALVLGAALGNLIRGVAIDGTGNFAIPFFTDLRAGRSPGVLDWYTILLGLFAVLLLALHGAAWILLKVTGPVAQRVRALGRPLFWSVAALGLACIAATFALQPSIYLQLLARPWSWPLPLLALAGFVALGRGLKQGPAWLAFSGSAVFIFATLAATAAALFPIILRSTLSPAYDATAYAAAAAPHGLRTALCWWLLGFPLAAGYTLYVYRSMKGRIES